MKRPAQNHHPRAVRRSSAAATSSRTNDGTSGCEATSAGANQAVLATSSGALDRRLASPVSPEEDDVDADRPAVGLERPAGDVGQVGHLDAHLLADLAADGRLQRGVAGVPLGGSTDQREFAGGVVLVG